MICGRIQIQGLFAEMLVCSRFYEIHLRFTPTQKTDIRKDLIKVLFMIVVLIWNIHKYRNKMFIHSYKCKTKIFFLLVLVLVRSFRYNGRSYNRPIGNCDPNETCVESNHSFLPIWIEKMATKKIGEEYNPIAFIVYGSWWVEIDDRI